MANNLLVETFVTNNINKSLPKKLIPFKDVFSEIYANELPPHRPYDCEIKLMPNTVLFYGPIYPLTEKESTALKEYIDEMLAKGYKSAPMLVVDDKEFSFGEAIKWVNSLEAANGSN